ncbi:MAG: redoxin domain-containing protein [Isosphaeraceae bacterium]|nr:redoxin domain-containing protein [Isosphaeraceae bacterium]
MVQQVPDDIFKGARGWINSRPLRPRDLRGKVILLDFWTYCCINCHHVLPDLARLEQKYRNQLVVIGIHSPKFDAERSTENIRQKVDEYRIKHPVVNDADRIIWNRFDVSAWPTLVLIAPNGQIIGRVSGEGHYEVLDRAIGQLVERARAAGTLDETPLVFPAESDKPRESGLYAPGKILADAKNDRLFIADTGHNRIVVTNRKGDLIATIGSGETGANDGDYAKASFNRPQGMCLFEGKLYVADTENHMIRAVDLESKTVATVAGTGTQAPPRSPGGPARQTPLNSPWDVLPLPGTRRLAIAMAGPHQIWTLDLDAGTVGPWAGNGVENIQDGSLSDAEFAQPSGLATDGKHLFVADSETSSVRSITLSGKAPYVDTIVGQGLFAFGDIDGQGPQVRLQHCLGLAYGDGKLYIADTYNNKIKVCDPKARTVRTLVGDGRAGQSDDPPRFYQPGGLSLAGEVLYVADTNNDAIRTIDLKTRRVATLPLAGVKPPEPPSRRPTFPNAEVAEVPATKVAPGKSLTLDVTLNLPAGFKLNPDAPIRYLLEAPSQPEALSEVVSPRGGRVDPPASTFQVSVPFAKEMSEGQDVQLKLSVSAFICKVGNEGYCTIKNYVWNVPISFVSGGASSIKLANATAGASLKK